MPSVVFGGNQQLTYTVGTGATSPVDTYAAWAADLGVSGVTTLQALDSDDTGFSALLANTFFEGGSTGLMFSSEAALGFYRTAPANTTSTSYTVSNISRMYGLTSRPTLLLSYHPANDLKSLGCKIQRSGTTTIIYAYHERYNSATSRYHAAIRITPQSIEFVGLAVDSSTPIYMTEMVETTSTTVVQQVLVAQHSAGVNTTLSITVATITPEGVLSDDSGPLGAPSVLARAPVYGWVEVDGPLGAPALFGQITILGWIEVSSPLNETVAVLGDVHRAAVIVVDSPLTENVGVLGFHDFTGQVGTSPTRYVMDLVTPSGVVRVPISSWQSTQQVDQSCYAQCVVPACFRWTEYIDAATEFVVYRAAKNTAGETFEHEMVRSPIEQIAYDRGARNYTATISGYGAALVVDEEPPAIYDRTLTGVRSVSVYNGQMRIRCVIDWLLRPGHRAYVDETTSFIVDYINYYSNDYDSYMDVGER